MNSDPTPYSEFTFNLIPKFFEIDFNKLRPIPVPLIFCPLNISLR